MNLKLIKILNELGLSEKEANIYLTCLSLGNATILQLSKESGLKRTTIYSIIDSLIKKGLISININSWKKLFVAEDPKKLEQLLEKRRIDFKKVLPDLSSLYNLKGGEHSIRYFEGLEAVKSVYLSLLENIKPHEDYLVIADQEKWLSLDEEFFLKFIKLRSKLNINIRLLFQQSPAAYEHYKKQKNYNESIKLLPKNINFTANLVVTPQKAIIHQLVPPIIAIVTENKNIIKMYQEIFNALWDKIK